MNEYCENATVVRQRYRCLNCGYSMEILNPCHSCGEGEFRCPFCGEIMTKKW
jgi:predicted nucleic acid-binding Zn ribbon protein